MVRLVPLAAFFSIVSSSSAFVPSVKVESVRGKTSLGVISRRDAFAAGAAALFGVVGGITPQPSYAADSNNDVEEDDDEGIFDDVSQMAPREFDGRVTINGAMVALGYSTLAGSLLLGSEPEDVCSSNMAQQRSDMASFDDYGRTVIVQQSTPSSLPTAASAMDSYAMQKLENQEENEQSEEIANI
eukprot:CAMPEP_0185723778 /NCGR_PEP_ID=MMETSP1171-20130828/502_1 /TAXON_ID=374046 /ORGANISM="Helicotheca tamensis, Strain CCMP826" /LENGTH=185 /DNA_ID=CAMNT_0028391531 /DNA_START=42 /DNA_END=599 /DNA_ORIENTATION=-